MELERLEHSFNVCKVKDLGCVDLSDEFIFISKTDEEISLVCRDSSVPKNTVAAEPDWRALRIKGILDFGMIGVIAEISKILSDNHISIFVVSTYNTDYIFLKAEGFEKAVLLLQNRGYTIK